MYYPGIYFTELSVSNNVYQARSAFTYMQKKIIDKDKETFQ